MGAWVTTKILWPVVALFHRFGAADHEQFNRPLANALTLHKQYWTANEGRTSTVRGLVPVGPLALACLAYDAGFPIEVESSYLPKHLLKGTWVGEFPSTPAVDRDLAAWLCVRSVAGVRAPCRLRCRQPLLRGEAVKVKVAKDAEFGTVVSGFVQGVEGQQ